MSPQTLAAASLESTSRQPRHLTLIVLVSIMLIGAGLRLFQLGERSFWLDEVWTVELSTGRGSPHLSIPFDQIIAPPPAAPTRLDDAPPIYRVWSNLGSATHPPLYFVLLRAWEEVFGTSEFATRSFSLLGSLVALVLLFDVAQQLLGPRAALWACAIFAVAGPQIMYARETRNYAMLLAVSLGAASALLRIERSGTNVRRLVALVVCTVAAALTHYFAAGAIVAMFTYSIMRLRRVDGRRTLIAFAAAALAGAAAWGPFIIEHVHRFGGASDPTTSFLNRTDGIGLYLASIGSVPFRLFVDLLLEHHKYAAWSILLLPVPLFLLRNRPQLLFATLWTLFTIGAIVLLDVARHAQHARWIRYTLLAGPGVYILIAAIADEFRIARHVVPAAIVLGCACMIYGPLHSAVPNWRALGRTIDEQTSDGDVLVFMTPGQADWVNGYLYLAAAHYSHRRPGAIALVHNPIPDACLAELSRYPRVWLIQPQRVDKPGDAPASVRLLAR